MFRLLFLSAIFAGSLLAETQTKIILPDKSNGRLLIFAHGYRPEGFPNPATIDTDAAAYKTLHDQGWILAATGYRRAGMVVEEGAADIDQLRDQIEKKYGPITRCILHGESMGGTIVTMLVERDPRRYQGAVAVGAALELLPKNKNWAGPKSPLLFLTNQSELAGPQKYVERWRTPQTPLALWKVARDGHCNVNQAEVLAAISAVDRTVATGSPLADRNATIAPKPGSSQVVAKPDGSISVKVREIDPVFGNFVVAAQVRDLARLGIKRGKDFTIQAGDTSRRVLFGKEFNDVPEGAWVAFENADGWLRIAMNFRNAATNLGIKKSDPILIRPVE